MASLDRIIVGGTVVTPQGRSRLNVGIKDGRIAYLGPERQQAGEEIDAAGLMILPGGVDTHIHLMDPAAQEREDFPHGTRAAAKAGVTTICEHTHAGPVRTVADLDEKRDYVQGRSNVDFGLVSHAWPGYSDHVAPLYRAGIAFFKVFTCTTHGVPGHDAAALKTHLTATAAVGAPSLIHCEDESLCALAEDQLKAANREDNAVICEWRNRDAELTAIAMAALMVRRTGSKATLAHLSHPEAIAYAVSERQRGANLSMESCPQYFLLREEEILDEGALRKFTPPARNRIDADEQRMWQLLRDGDLTFISSDHAPSTMAQKQSGTIWKVQFGLPGVDTTFPSLIDAVARQQLAWEDVAKVYAENPARTYGFWGRKGAVQVGFDADLALIDPTVKWTLADSDIESKAKWSPFSGRELTGRTIHTILRGQTIAKDGDVADDRAGEFVPGGGAGVDR